MARKGQARRVERRSAATPVVFISGTTKDLAAARRHVAAVVKRAGLKPVVANLFETVPHNVDLANWVSLKLRDCAAVIHLAGLHFLPKSSATDVSFVQQPRTRSLSICSNAFATDTEKSPRGRDT
jgi:hypothetical protein